MFFKHQTPPAILFRTFLGWLPLAAGLTVMSLLVYGTVQQNYRQSLNDPQIQVAEDAAAALAAGATPQSVVPIAKVDIAKSLSLFVTIFDKNNAILASNAVLDGSTPVPPVGVINSVRKFGQNRVSWQPQPDVRSATVSFAVNDESGRVVMVGRSMREVELRVSQLSLMVLGAWVISILVTLLAKIAVSFII